MAVATGQVARQADIDLNCVDRPGMQRRAGRLLDLLVEFVPPMGRQWYGRERTYQLTSRMSLTPVNTRAS